MINTTNMIETNNELIDQILDPSSTNVIMSMHEDQQKASIFVDPNPPQQKQLDNSIDLIGSEAAISFPQVKAMPVLTPSFEATFPHESHQPAKIEDGFSELAMNTSATSNNTSSKENMAIEWNAFETEDKTIKTKSEVFPILGKKKIDPFSTIEYEIKKVEQVPMSSSFKKANSTIIQNTSIVKKMNTSNVNYNIQNNADMINLNYHQNNNSGLKNQFPMENANVAFNTGGSSKGVGGSNEISVKNNISVMNNIGINSGIVGISTNKPAMTKINDPFPDLSIL